MGKYDYEDAPVVNVNYRVAIKQLNYFIANEHLHTDFIQKLTISKDIYLVNSIFNTIAFYFMFKSHFRYSSNLH